MVTNRLQVLKALSHDYFVSGQKVADQLGISRSAVNKHIKSLADYGVEIYQVTGRGYKLANPVSLIDYEQLVLALSCSKSGLSKDSIFYHPIIDSTNKFLIDNMDRITTDLALCVADFQEQGRGRQGRTWLSPMGANLTFSMSVKFSLSLNELSTLSLRVGIAIADAIEQITNKKLQLKWPNDLYYQDKKLGGILIQLIGEVHSKSIAVIGVGLNVSSQPHLGDSDYKAISLCQIAEEEVSRYDLLARIVNQFIVELADMGLENDITFITRWQDYDVLHGKPIKFIRHNQEECGVGLGIDQHGGYRVRLANNNIVTLYGGEISIRRL